MYVDTVVVGTLCNICDLYLTFFFSLFDNTSLNVHAMKNPGIVFAPLRLLMLSASHFFVIRPLKVTFLSKEQVLLLQVLLNIKKRPFLQEIL